MTFQAVLVDRGEGENAIMIDVENTAVPRDVMSDLEEVCRQAASGIVRDPELLRRINERSAKAREETVRKFGVQDIGVQIIREMRDAR